MLNSSSGELLPSVALSQPAPARPSAPRSVDCVVSRPKTVPPTCGVQRLDWAANGAETSTEASNGNKNLRIAVMPASCRETFDLFLTSSPGQFKGMSARHGRRVLSFLSLLVFLLGTSGAALSRHLCPHHDSDVLAAAQTGQHAHHQSAASDSDSEHQGCTCVGRCVQNTATALPAVANVASLPAPAIIEVPTFHVRAHTHEQPPHLLPFANAPPVIA